MIGIAYICDTCGHRFDGDEVDERVYIDTDVGCAQYRETREQQCPHCGSGDFDACEACAICGEPFASFDLDYGVCHRCAHEVEDKAARILKDRLEAEEYDFIREWLDLPEVV